MWLLLYFQHLLSGILIMCVHVSFFLRSNQCVHNKCTCPVHRLLCIHITRTNIHKMLLFINIPLKQSKSVENMLLRAFRIESIPMWEFESKERERERNENEKKNRFRSSEVIWKENSFLQQTKVAEVNSYVLYLCVRCTIVRISTH